MKKLYWSSHQFRAVGMAIICLISLLCLWLVETHKKRVPQPYYDLKLEAAKISDDAFDTVKKLRKKKGIAIESKFDPAKSGLIGYKNTEITSDHGVLRSKQISLNPNLAGLMVGWLKSLSLKEGDVVAIGMTGSFPALDISTLAAIKELGLKPLIITSVASSNWGANIEGLTILDILSYLDKKNIFSYMPIAASIGAAQDIGASLSHKGVNLALNTIKRYNIPLIKEETVSLSIDKRLSFYLEAAEKLDKPISAYINIGGGVASVGKHFAKNNLTKEQKEAIKSTRLPSGINRELPVSLANTNSVAIRFLKEGVPVINIRDISSMTAKYNLKPWLRDEPVGKGPIFFGEAYNIWLAFFSLAIILLLCALEKRIQIQKKQKELEI